MNNIEIESSTSSSGSTSLNGVVETYNNAKDKQFRKKSAMITRKLSVCSRNSENMFIYTTCNKEKFGSSLLNADPRKKDMILAELQNVIKMCATSQITLASKGTSTIRIFSANQEIMEWVKREHLVLERLLYLLQHPPTLENINRQKQNLEQIEKLVKTKIKLENAGVEKKKEIRSRRRHNHNRKRNKSLQVCYNSLVTNKLLKKVISKIPTSTQTVSAYNINPKRRDKSVQECLVYQMPPSASIKIQTYISTATKATTTLDKFDPFSYVSPYYENFTDNINKSNSSKKLSKADNKKFVDKSSQIRFSLQEAYSSSQPPQEIVTRSPQSNSIHKLSYVMSFIDSDSKLGEPYIESFESLKSGQSSAVSGYTRSVNRIVSEGTSTCTNSGKLNKPKEVSFYNDMPSKGQSYCQPHSQSNRQNRVGDHGPYWGNNCSNSRNGGDQRSKSIKQQNYNQNLKQDRAGDFNVGLLKSSRERLFDKGELGAQTLPPEMYANSLCSQDLKRECNDSDCVLCRLPRKQIQKQFTSIKTDTGGTDEERHRVEQKLSPVRCSVRSPSFNDKWIPKDQALFGITPNPTQPGRYINESTQHNKNVNQSGNLISRPDTNVNRSSKVVYSYYDSPIRL